VDPHDLSANVEISPPNVNCTFDRKYGTFDERTT
jgi:hypothetical protein